MCWRALVRPRGIIHQTDARRKARTQLRIAWIPIHRNGEEVNSSHCGCNHYAKARSPAPQHSAQVAPAGTRTGTSPAPTVMALMESVMITMAGQPQGCPARGRPAPVPVGATLVVALFVVASTTASLLRTSGPPGPYMMHARALHGACKGLARCAPSATPLDSLGGSVSSQEIPSPLPLPQERAIGGGCSPLHTMLY
jgi:hypothetical protein